MKLTSKTIIVLATFFFFAGGSYCAWIMDDNNLLQGASTQSEIARRFTERRNDIIQAFLIGGCCSGLIAGGLLLAVQKFTNRHGDS